MAYISSQTATFLGQSLTITKPTSLAEGDLMIAHIYATVSGGGLSINTPSGWTLVTSIAPLNSIAIFSKIATTADVAASNFTFTASNCEAMVGGISRWNGVNRVDQSNTGYVNNTTGNTYTTTGITPTKENSYFMLFTGIRINSDTPNITTYAIANNNPTWTEAYDFIVNLFSSSYFGGAMAYGSRPEITASGTSTATASGSVSSSRYTALINIYLLVMSLTTDAVSNLDYTSATLNGNITDDAGAVITERGFVISTSTNPIIGGATTLKYIVSGTTGSYSYNKTGLLPNTTYYVKAYGINSNGTKYGDEVSFTTPSIPNNFITKDISGVDGQTYAVRLYIGGSTGTLTVKIGSTGYSETFNAGAGYVVLQGVYGGLSGLIFEASGTFNGYIDDISWVLILGTATIDWDLDSLTNIFPINSSVLFRRIEDKDFNKFRIYRYLDVQFKDLDAYVTVLLKKESNEGLATSSKEFLVSNTSNDVLPFIDKKLSMLTKNQAIRIGVSNNRLNETFTVCQFIIKGYDQSSKAFDASKIINIT